jgi:IclR family acetate operon transcriptional repressor
MESVRNALKTLVFMGQQGSVRISEVADELGLARSTTHRLLATLREAGFVVQQVGSHSYILGPTFAGLAAPTEYHDALIAAARPMLNGLRHATEETVHLVTRTGMEVYFLDGAESIQQLRVGLRTGTRLPVVTSAAGLAILARLSPERVERVIGLTKRVRTLDEAWLTDQLDAAHALGFAVTYGLATREVNAVGVAFNLPFGRQVAALTVAAPASRLNLHRARELAPIIKHAADSIAYSLAR